MTTTNPATLADKMQEHGVDVQSVFVPFSRSRNAKPNPALRDLSLNWRCTILVHGCAILTTDYQQGIGHCTIGLKVRLSVADVEAIRAECETGRACQPGLLPGKRLAGPTPADVLACLLSDASALDYPSYEDWAADLGYDPDSRKGEKDYRACLEIALKLRAGLGEQRMAALRDAAQDY